jgi:hypothetical protein
MQKTTQIHKKNYFLDLFLLFFAIFWKKQEKNVKIWFMTIIKKRKGKKEIA